MGRSARVGLGPPLVRALEFDVVSFARLRDELVRYLDLRPSASAGHGGGGRGGGGIDPEYLHEMHSKMDASFGFEEKKARLEKLKVRLAELRDE